jgi:hypothetical protein
MNLIFKIVNYFPEAEQIEVKYCRQNAPKSIDDYPSGMIDCKNIDFTDYEAFTKSIMNYGLKIIYQQEYEETTVDSNIEDEDSFSTNIEDNLNRVIMISSDDLNKQTTYRLKKIEL